MDTKVASSVELSRATSNSHNVDALKSEILSQHQQSQLTDRKSNEIVEILGGIDNILTHYLKSNTIELTLDQLTRLQNTFQDSTNDQIQTDINPNLEAQGDNHTQLTYTFNIKDNLYHKWFNEETASKLIYYTYHIMTFISIICLMAIWVVWANIFGLSHAYYIYKCVSFGIVYIITIFITLSINNSVFKKMLHQFVFWFKTIISIQQAILLFMLRYFMVKDRDPSFVNICGDIFSQLVVVALVVNFSAIDGHQASRRIKISFGLIISALFTWDAAFATIFPGEDEKALIFVGSLQFSVGSLYSSALRTLSIFLWKQTISMIRSGDKCINIKHTPKMKWVS